VVQVFMPNLVLKISYGEVNVTDKERLQRALAMSMEADDLLGGFRVWSSRCVRLGLSGGAACTVFFCLKSYCIRPLATMTYT